MDNYSLKARTYPVLILFLPLVIIGITYSIAYENYLQLLSTIGISTALSYFLSNIGRDFGKKKESALWNHWGGAPTSQLLNYQNDSIDNITKDRYHTKLLELVTIKKEIDFKKSAKKEIDEIYRAWTKYLKTKTRDTKKYSLVYKENVSYGFRRNLWGLKLFSIILIIINIVANYSFQSVKHGFKNLTAFPLEFFISEFLLFALLIIWVVLITRNWVKVPAFAYAERLLEAVDSIEKDNI